FRQELAWRQQEPSERRLSFVPRRFPSLRAVPAYPRFIHERFERCLDLYLCPRQRRMRVNVDPEDLIPKLPRPRDLQPFPTTQALLVMQVTWHGQGDSCAPVVIQRPVTQVTWHSQGDSCAPAMIQRVRISGSHPDPIPNPISIPFQPVMQVTWHGKGDYWASVVRNPGSRQVLIHQSSRRWSQDPFRKSPGMIQCVQFHPLRPYFLVASQRSVRIYNLLRQELTKKLQSNCQWISSMAVHPGGAGSARERRDLPDPSSCKGMGCAPPRGVPRGDGGCVSRRHHGRAVRSVAFHRRYPLFASGSDDGSVIVCHGMVYNDLLQNALLVPLKVLKGHAPALDLGVLDVAFHPQQPWLFSSGADGTVRLFT
ncbi:ribosome biogenesis protein bop1-like, partial [Passer montanus]|uniref:ribosome biogenesis protein bop1-like n=1 Tax=Passer montanus TaxID=9160 RepID=UPI0019609988